MNYQEPFKISNIDLNRIVYPKHKSNQNKKIVLIKYNEKSKLKNFVFQTPTLFNLFKPQNSNGFAEIELALVGKEANKVTKFIKFLNELENRIKSDAQTNASNWFNITHDNQTINFQKIIRESDDYSNGTIKIKIIKNNDFETILQLNNSKKIGINDIPEDSWCKMILECYAIWVNSNNDFGIFFRPVLASFTPKEKQVYNYKFLEESDEEQDFDIPDTEVNNNIFMKINSSKSPNNESRTKAKYNDSTSQLELDELVKQLESEEDQKTSEINLSILNTTKEHNQPNQPNQHIQPLKVGNPNNISNKQKQDILLEINLENKYFSNSDTESDADSESESELNSELFDTDIKDKLLNEHTYVNSLNDVNIDAETSDD
jgi:hypothetical protein